MLGVGVTGHRAAALKADDLSELRSCIGKTLALAGQVAGSLAESNAAFFDASPPSFRLVSPIADGADQIAAEVALELGWDLQVILPFERQSYRSSLANATSRAG
ncbi:MAG: hypothetical protein ABIO68_04355, partial [Sphingomicrobium sp.]